MVLKEHPITHLIHKHWIEKIQSEFPHIIFPESNNYLSLIKYIENAPQKFYNVEAFNIYLGFLNWQVATNSNLLVSILKDSTSEINISNKSLFEINKKSIHDIFFPDDDNELFDFIDREIHYNYLKILEGSFYHLILLPAKVSRISRNVSADKLDLYNAVQELEKGSFCFIKSAYNNTVRNGIAHGKVVFKNIETDYIDKQGKKETLRTKAIINLFDNLVDTVNGFILALKIFYFTNSDFLKHHDIHIPQSILTEELQMQADGPAWKVINCVDSYAPFIDQSQLMIYVENGFWDYNKVMFNSFRTAILAESFSANYKRLFFSFKSKHSYAGFAAFDANKLKFLRESGTTNFADYKGVLENDLLFFVPKYKFPKIVYKLGNIYMAMKIVMPLKWQEHLSKSFPKSFLIREVKAHTRKYFTVVEDPSVIIKKEFHDNIPRLIRENYKKILRAVINETRKKESYFSGIRYKPVRHIRVFIYDTDLRVRDLRSSGLIKELICSIGFNTSDKIPMIDIIGGTPEQIGKYRIVWNKKWLEKHNLSSKDL